MARLALLVLCALIAFPGRCVDAIAPAAGECCHYKLGGVGKLKVHFYVCCNNCDAEGQNPGWCNRITYDKASNGDYCGDCGEDKGVALGKSDPFHCGGCDGQAKVKAACDKRHRWVFKGFCWVWSTCFSLRCKRLFPRDKRSLQDSSYDSGTFCGDGNCDPDENHISCPFDCCPQENPESCTHHCNRCPPLCCSKPGCCKG